MQQIEEMSDADISEVQESATLFRGVEDTTADVRGLLDFLCGLRWMTAGMKKRERISFESPLVETLGSRPDAAYALLSRGESSEAGLDDVHDPGFDRIWSDAQGRSRTGSVSCTGRWRSRVCGRDGRTRVRVVDSTR